MSWREFKAPLWHSSLPTNSKKAKPLTNRLVVEGYSTREWLDGSFWRRLFGFVAAMWQVQAGVVEDCCHTILLHVSTAP